MNSLRRFSAAIVWAWKKRRASFMWLARRSVGVGDGGRESSLVVGEDF